MGLIVMTSEGTAIDLKYICASSTWSKLALALIIMYGNTFLIRLFTEKTTTYEDVPYKGNLGTLAQASK